MKKYRWVMASLFFVTLAQVLLSLAMQSHSPPLTVQWLMSGSLETLYLLIGLGSYLLSLLTWTQALRYLSLAHAYPLLSLSYVLVWGVTFLLPGQLVTPSWQAILGLSLIVSGVYLIVATKEK